MIKINIIAIEMISITPPDVVPMINPRESDIGAEIIK
jgi:hypothetical protein